MKKIFILTMISYQTLFALDLNVTSSSEHMQILCNDDDLEASDHLLQLSEKVYAQLSEAFQHQIDHKIQIHLFPDILSFHEKIQQVEAPDWLILQYGPPIKMVSPSNPGPYHTSQNIQKALIKGIAHTFVYDKFEDCKAPWWLISGVTSKKADWPYTQSSSLPGIEELEAATYKTRGIGWATISIVSHIEENFGWEAILQLLEDYSSFEQILGLSKDEFILQWKSSLDLSS